MGNVVSSVGREERISDGEALGKQGVKFKGGGIRRNKTEV